MTRVVCEGANPREVTASSFMTPRPFTVDATIAPLEALRIMLRNHYRHLPVCFGPGEHGLVDVLALSYGALDLGRLRVRAAPARHRPLRRVPRRGGDRSPHHPPLQARSAHDTPTRGTSVLKRLAGALSLLSRPPETMQQLAEESVTEGGVDGALLDLCGDGDLSRPGGDGGVKSSDAAALGGGAGGAEARDSGSPAAAASEKPPSPNEAAPGESFEPGSNSASRPCAEAGDSEEGSCGAGDEEAVDPASLVRALEEPVFAPARAAMARGDSVAQSGDMAAAVAAYKEAISAVDAAAATDSGAPTSSALAFCRATALMRRAQALTVDECSADAQADYRCAVLATHRLLNPTSHARAREADRLHPRPTPAQRRAGHCRR